MLKGMTIVNMPITIKGKVVREITFDTFKKPMSIDNLQKYANKVSKALNKLEETTNCQISACVNYGSHKRIDGTLTNPIWRNGAFVNVGNNVKLYNWSYRHGYNVDTSKAYELKFYVTYADMGFGEDKHNDCVYNCMKKILCDKMPFDSPQELKEFLGLKRDDKIPFDCIAIIDKYLEENNIQHKLRVKGDFVYQSGRKTNKIIPLIIINEHAILPKKKDECRIYDKYFVSNCFYNDKKPIIYTKYAKNKYACFDGEKHFFIDTTEFRALNKNLVTYMVNHDMITTDRDMPLTEAYDDYIQIANELKNITNGKINMYKTGSYANTALKLFIDLNPDIIPEPIKQYESIYINNASVGAIMYSVPYNGEAYMYDVVSMYPSILRSEFFMVPIKKGEFMKLTTFGDYIKHGIYRCNIKGTHPLFRTNNKNLYTHIDLGMAKLYGLGIELIDDSEVNALIYKQETLVKASWLFGKYIDMVFPLKKQGIKSAKNILNVLWGRLCQINELEHVIDMNDKQVFELYDNSALTSIIPIDDNERLVKYVNVNRSFDTPFARMKPFLLAKAREKLGKLIHKDIDNIVRIHTDGFISKCKLDIPIGDNIGDLKFEGYTDNCTVVNCNNYDGFD